MGAISARIAAMLSQVADSLAACRSPTAFYSALWANDRAWRQVARVRAEIGWAVPVHVERFALSILPRTGRGVSDHDIEELIAHNRAIAAALGDMPASPSGISTSAGRGSVDVARGS